MKRVLKMLTFIIAICLVFSACSIITDVNDSRNDDDIYSDNKFNDEVNDNETNGNNGTVVNGLPEIRLTEEMTKDEIIKALSECKNYKLSYTLSYPDQYAVINYHITESGYYMDFYAGTSVNDISFQSLSCHLIENLHVYTLIYDLTDLDANEGLFTAFVGDNDADISISAYDQLWEFLNEEEWGEPEVKDGKIIFNIESASTGEMCQYVFHDFNSTIFNVEEYFPDYKSLDVGEYECTIDWEYVKELVQ